MISDGSDGLAQVLLTGDGAFDLRTSNLLALKQMPDVLAPREARGGFGNINFLVPDPEAIARRIEAAGGTARRAPNGIVVVRDPDGYSIELLPAQE